MKKITYLSVVPMCSLTSAFATEVLLPSNTAGLAVEWVGLIVLAIIGFILIYRNRRQIIEIKKLQNELDTHNKGISEELNIIGGKDA